MTGAVRVIGYVRVSTDKQTESGLGLESQRQTLERECSRRGWILSELIVDEGLSGKSLNREGLQRAFKQLAEGGAEVLMAAKLDRLSRSVSDVCQIGDIAGHYGWNLVLLDCAIDTTTPYGRAQLNVMATFAQLERELIGLRTKEALAVKKSQGVRLGRPVAVTLEVVEQITTLRAAGKSMAAIADQLNEQNVPTARGGGQWFASTVHCILTREAA